MICKQCGAQIRKSDKRADGKYECPGCGKVYRVKQNPNAAGAAAATAAARKRAARKRNRRARIIALAVLLVLIVAAVLALTLGGSDRTSEPPAAAGSANAPTAAVEASPSVIPTETPAEPAEAPAVSGQEAAQPAEAAAEPDALPAVADADADALPAEAAAEPDAADASEEASAAEPADAESEGETADAGALPDADSAAAASAGLAAGDQTASVHFRAVGDVMSHKLQLTHARQKDGTYSYDSQFQFVKEALSKADYTIANLELSIAVDDEYSSYPRFRTPEAILDTLKDCGVDLLTLANNHILDAFFEGLVKTVDEVEERGFVHVGADRTKEESEQPTLVDINGIRFGFLAYTCYLNENDKRLDKETSAFCVKRLDGADFEGDVKQLRDAGAEVVICMPHWGVEGRRSVSDECEKIGKRMVEAGVDIILGSHPHVVLPIFSDKLEVNGEEKDILVAWSMGNFISYMANQYVDSGIIVDFTVTRDAEGKISIHDVGYVPVYVAGCKEYFHLLCSGDFYDEKPSGMSSSDYTRMKQSVKEIAAMIGDDGITMLQN